MPTVLLLANALPLLIGGLRRVSMATRLTLLAITVTAIGITRNTVLLGNITGIAATIRIAHSRWLPANLLGKFDIVLCLGPQKELRIKLERGHCKHKIGVALRRKSHERRLDKNVQHVMTGPTTVGTFTPFLSADLIIHLGELLMSPSIFCIGPTCLRVKATTACNQTHGNTTYMRLACNSYDEPRPSDTAKSPTHRKKVRGCEMQRPTAPCQAFLS